MAWQLVGGRGVEEQASPASQKLGSLTDKEAVMHIYMQGSQVQWHGVPSLRSASDRPWQQGKPPTGRRACSVRSGITHPSPTAHACHSATHQLQDSRKGLCWAGHSQADSHVRSNGPLGQGRKPRNGLGCRCHTRLVLCTYGVLRGRGRASLWCTQCQRNSARFTNPFHPSLSVRRRRAAWHAPGTPGLPKQAKLKQAKPLSRLRQAQVLIQNGVDVCGAGSSQGWQWAG